jgi:hypothetical protein
LEKFKVQKFIDVKQSLNFNGVRSNLASASIKSTKAGGKCEGKCVSRDNGKTWTKDKLNVLMESNFKISETFSLTQISETKLITVIT